MRSIRHTCALVLIAALLVVLALRSHLRSTPGSTFPHLVLDQLELDLETIRGLRIGVIEQTSHHEEVIGAVLTVLHDMKANFTLHRREFTSGFDEIIRDVYSDIPEPINKLDDILVSDPYHIIISTTCDYKFWYDWSKLHQLVINSQARFVCIAHEIEGFDNEKNKVHLEPLAEGGRLRMMTLSEHSMSRMRDILAGWGEDDQQSMWNAVPVAEFAPTFRLPQEMRRDINRKEIPTSAAILGRMLSWSRRYDEILTELAESISDEPELWGYQFVDGTTDLKRSDENAFTLHLIGKSGKEALNIPQILLSEKKEDGVVIIHDDTAYSTFYNLIGSMDLVLPAFKKRLYYDHRASAAVPAAIISRTPLLANDDLSIAYPYIAPPALIQQSQGLSEIQAIAELRKTGVKGLKSGSSDWEAYEDYLKRSNMERWIEVLGEGSDLAKGA